MAVELDPAGVFRAEPPTGTVALFSCQPREKSYDLKELGHSVFTHHVIEYLTGRAGADRYPRREVTVEELVPFVRNRTRESADTRLGQRQKPEALAPDAKIPDWSLGTLASLASLDRPAPVDRPLPAAATAGVGTVRAELDVAEVRARFLLADEPAGALSLTAAMTRLTTNPLPVVIAGRIGGRGTNPFLDGKASFSLLEIPGDAQAKRPGQPIAVVRFLGDDGREIPFDARELFGVKAGQDVVIRGRGVFDPKLAVKILQIRADGIHVRNRAK